LYDFTTLRLSFLLCYPGDKTVQCGRKVDSVKLYMMWKGLGDSGMEAVVDRAFDNTR